MTPKQPATAAGRAADANLHQPWCLVNRGLRCDCGLTSSILAIEAEAAAGMSEQHSDIGLLALREAIGTFLDARDEAMGYRGSDDDYQEQLDRHLLDAERKLRSALADTAPAAAEIEARIEQRGYDRGYLQAVKYHGLGQPAVDDWLASPEAEQRLAVALFSVLGWPTRRTEFGVASLPDGLVTGDPDNPEWAKTTRAILAALREQPATEEAGQ